MTVSNLKKYSFVISLCAGAVLGLILFQLLTEEASLYLYSYQKEFWERLRQSDATSYDYMLSSFWNRMWALFFLFCIRFTVYSDVLYGIMGAALGMGASLLLRMEIAFYQGKGLIFALALLLPHGILYGIVLWEFLSEDVTRWKGVMGSKIVRIIFIYFLAWLLECTLNPWLIKKVMLLF